MKNKTLFLQALVLMSASMALQAYYDDRYDDRGFVGRTVTDPVRSTGDVATDVARTPGNVLTGIFGSREDRAARREENRRIREDRRNGYYR